MKKTLWLSLVLASSLLTLTACDKKEEKKVESQEETLSTELEVSENPPSSISPEEVEALQTETETSTEFAPESPVEVEKEAETPA